MKIYGGVDLQIHASLTSELDAGEWSTSRSGRFTLGNESLVSRAPEFGVEEVIKKQTLCPCRESKSIVQPVASQHAD